MPQTVLVRVVEILPELESFRKMINVQNRRRIIEINRKNLARLANGTFSCVNYETYSTIYFRHKDFLTYSKMGSIESKHPIPHPTAFLESIKGKIFITLVPTRLTLSVTRGDQKYDVIMFNNFNGDLNLTKS